MARAAGAPVFADIASGLRGEPVPEGALLCAHADLLLRDEAVAALAPDFILRLGGIPTSKTLATWLARHRAPLVAIQPDERRRDPDGIVGEVVVATGAVLCELLASQVKKGARDDDWLAALRAGEEGARALVHAAPREAAALVAACNALPDGAALFLSSSMPIRWGEMYAGELPGGVEVFANRGANGIDGIVSSAIGVALGSGKPTLLVTGDLAFLHDAGGLRSARELRTPLAILLLDNDGGGIFSHLPVARHEAHFEPLFGTPHGCDLAAASRAARVEHVVAQTLEEVASLAGATLSGGGVRVIEWRSDRAQTVREQAALTRLPAVHADRVEAGGLAWQVRSRGPLAGTPLVLLHGFTGTGEFWLPVAHALPGRRCIFPDLPGHGGTDAPPAGMAPGPRRRRTRRADGPAGCGALRARGLLDGRAARAFGGAAPSATHRGPGTRSAPRRASRTMPIERPARTPTSRSRPRSRRTASRPSAGSGKPIPCSRRRRALLPPFARRCARSASPRTRGGLRRRFAPSAPASSPPCTASFRGSRCRCW